MSFTPTKYDLKLTIDFYEQTFTGNAHIHVDVTDSVKEFDLKISKNLEIERISFWEAKFIFRGNPDLIGGMETFEVDKENETVHATLLNDVTAESIKEEGYIEVKYKGKFGESGAVDGLHHVEGATFEASLNSGNVITLFPILEDIPVPIKLSVITPYRAGVETNIATGKHEGVWNNADLFSYNFNSGEEKMLISELQLKLTAPDLLVLQ